MGLGQFADLRGELGKKEGVVFFFVVVVAQCTLGCEKWFW